MSFTELADKYLTDELLPSEETLFFQLLEEPKNRLLLEELIDNQMLSGSLGQDKQYLLRDLNFRMIREKLKFPQADGAPVVHRIHFLRTAWFRYAASIIVVLGVATYLWFAQTPAQPTPAIAADQSLKKDIAAGKDGAILVLADGTQVNLDSTGDREIAMQSGTKLAMRNGQLTYATLTKADGEPVYNTVITPKGRQFQVVLPDGSKVWLNAASSLRYPTVFAGKERHVEINGEAYFEVAPNSNQPFTVLANQKASIEVLGTAFNVNAYADETSLEATLVSGRIKVNSKVPGSVKAITLKPGEQARVEDDISLVKNIDIDQVTAWKNGLFNFQNKSLEELMRQIARWYDVDVVFEGKIPSNTFWGGMKRGVSLSKVLLFLEGSGVRFKLKGRTLTVMNNSN